MRDRLTILWARWALVGTLALSCLVGCGVKFSFTAGPADGRRFVQYAQRPDEMSQEQILNLAMSRLHEHVQPDGPVAVMWSDTIEQTSGALASTRRLGPGYLIILSRKLQGFTLADTIVHEWAHALADTPDYVDDGADCGGHGPLWGVELSRAYRAVWYNASSPDFRVSQKNAPAAVDPAVAISPSADH